MTNIPVPILHKKEQHINVIPFHYTIYSVPHKQYSSVTLCIFALFLV